MAVGIGWAWDFGVDGRDGTLERALIELMTPLHTLGLSQRPGSPCFVSW